MSAQLNAELIRWRQHELATTAARARHARELGPTSRAARHTPGRPWARVRRAAVIVAVALTGGLAIATTASAATSSAVVPAGGTVADHSYGQWQAISWQYQFSHTNGGSPCSTVQTPEGPVELLAGAAAGTHTYRCAFPAGRPVYAIGLDVECSSIEAPPYHGNTPAQLKSCARRNYRGARDVTAKIDGHTVAGYRKLVTATPVFTFRLATKNILGSAKPSGRSASYGEGLLLKGLSAGSHRIDTIGAFPKVGFHAHLIYELHVTG